ncbi:MAG: sensor histidine kinase, partial [Mogibacterium diversum]|nr:sensor histidine kinase [Mogibacterium diversum]
TYLGNRDDGNILYMIAPLYPVESTISILRSQLLYITFITLMIASMLAIIMSTWLSLPIASITKSAVQLSNGNYNVNFNGGIFTETNELARTLNKASYEMQKTDSYQRDLIANVSHDLKTPLTMIKSYAEMINDISGDNPEKRAEHLAVIIAEADRLNKLVSDMLSASRLQSNSAELNMTKFDIVKAATEVEETFEVLNQQEGYNISFNKCKTAYVYGDYDKLKQVMANLISNAIKYCGKDKYVRIELKKVGRNVRFDVIDHGDGIAAEEISHVWERYYRTSANRNRNIEGTGLGLSIVKGILSLHNANYGVESEEGKGSDFWFELATVKK